MITSWFYRLSVQSRPQTLFCLVRVLQPYVNAVCFSSPHIAAMFILKSHRLTPGLFVAISPRRTTQTCEGQLLFWCLAPKQKHQRVLSGKSTRETNSCTGRSTIGFVFFFVSSALRFDPLLLCRCHEDIILNSRLSQCILSWEQLYWLCNTSHSSPVNIEEKKKQGARRVGPLWLSGYNMMS